jgi:hypothetical protein
VNAPDREYLDLTNASDRERLEQEVEAAVRECVAALVKLNIQLNIPVDEEEVRDRLWNDLRDKFLRH